MLSCTTSRLTVAGDLRIARGTGGFGNTGTTLFTHDDGAVHVGGTLRVENIQLQLPPEYRFNGGTLTANAVLINGNFRQTGGHFEVAGNLAVNFTDAPGLAAFSGGTLHVQNVISPSLGRIGFGGAAVTAGGLAASTGLGSPTGVGVGAGTVSLGTVNFQGTWTLTGGATTIGSGIASILRRHQRQRRFPHRRHAPDHDGDYQSRIPPPDGRRDQRDAPHDAGRDGRVQWRLDFALHADERPEHRCRRARVCVGRLRVLEGGGLRK